MSEIITPQEKAVAQFDHENKEITQIKETPAPREEKYWDI